jgi:hypothetical protein
VTDNPAPAHLQKLPLTLNGTAGAALELDRQAGRKRRHLPAPESAGTRPPRTQLPPNRFWANHPCPTAGHAPVKEGVRRVQPHERFKVPRLERRRQNTIDPHAHMLAPAPPRPTAITASKGVGTEASLPRVRARARDAERPLAREGLYEQGGWIQRDDDEFVDRLVRRLPRALAEWAKDSSGRSYIRSTTTKRLAMSSARPTTTTFDEFDNRDVAATRLLTSRVGARRQAYFMPGAGSRLDDALASRPRWTANKPVALLGALADERGGVR